MIRVSKRYRFSASHRLHSERLTEAENAELYGKCNNPFGHGHNYVLEVCAAGPVDAETGEAVRIPQLDALVEACVLRDFEHRNMNTDIAEFVALTPTTENLVKVVEERLRSGWRQFFPGEWPRFAGVTIQETPRNRFEITI